MIKDIERLFVALGVLIVFGLALVFAIGLVSGDDSAELAIEEGRADSASAMATRYRIIARRERVAADSVKVEADRSKAAGERSDVHASSAIAAHDAARQLVVIAAAKDTTTPDTIGVITPAGDTVKAPVPHVVRIGIQASFESAQKAIQQLGLSATNWRTAALQYELVAIRLDSAYQAEAQRAAALEELTRRVEAIGRIRQRQAAKKWGTIGMAIGFAIGVAVTG